MVSAMDNFDLFIKNLQIANINNNEKFIRLASKDLIFLNDCLTEYGRPLTLKEQMLTLNPCIA